MDTVIFIKNGAVEKVFSVSLEVKVPSGMMEADLARPIVVVNDFDSGKLEFEIYSYGEETIVVPVQARSISPAAELAAKVVKQEFQKFSDFVKVDMITNEKCIVYVPVSKKAMIIGKGGATIEQIEKKLGLSIDVREIDEKTTTRNNTIQYQVKFDKKNLTFLLHSQNADKDTDLYINDEYLLTLKSGKNATIKLNKQSTQGKELVHALNESHKVELRQ